MLTGTGVGCACVTVSSAGKTATRRPLCGRPVAPSGAGMAGLAEMKVETSLIPSASNTGRPVSRCHASRTRAGSFSPADSP